MQTWRRLCSSLRYIDAIKFTKQNGAFVSTDPRAKQFVHDLNLLDHSDFEHQAKRLVMDVERPLEFLNELGARIRVMSLGSIRRDSYPDITQHNYIASVCVSTPERVGLSWADINDGTIKFQESVLDNLEDDLARISPCEIILEKPSDVLFGARQKLVPRYPTTYVKFPRAFNSRAFALFDSVQSLKHAQNLMSPQTAAAMAGLLGYINDTTSHQIKFSVPQKYLEQESMGMDKRTRHTLELFASASRSTVKGSLLSSIKRTKTQSGARSLHELLSSPHRSIEKIKDRQSKIEALLSSPYLLARVQAALVGYPDCKLAIQRLLNDSTTHYIHRWAVAIEGMSDILKLIEPLPQFASWVQELRQCLNQTARLGNRIFSCMRDTSEDFEESKEYKPIFDPAISKPLTDLYKLKSGFEEACERILDSYSKKYDSPVIRRNTVHGYHIVIRQDAHPNDKVLRVSKRSTIIKDEELSKIGKMREQFNTRLERMEEKLVEKLRQRILQLNSITRCGIDTVDDIDIAQSFAHLSQEYSLVCPEIVEHPVLDIVEGRHIAVEHLLILREGTEFVPNNCKLTEKKVCLVTGPNMGGKSTYMRQIATTVILAHLGCFVPARSATIGIVDKVFCRIGSVDDGFRGQSTFMLEMLESAHILRNVSSQSLAMLDEIGCGTSERDSVSLTYSTIYYLAKHINCRALVSTHSGGSTHRLIEKDHLSVSTQTAQDYKMRPGVCSNSRGVDLAEIADFPERALKDARLYLEK